MRDLQNISATMSGWCCGAGKILPQMKLLMTPKDGRLLFGHSEARAKDTVISNSSDYLNIGFRRRPDIGICQRSGPDR